MKNIIRLLPILLLTTLLAKAQNQNLLQNDFSPSIPFQKTAKAGMTFGESPIAVHNRNFIHPDLADSLQVAVEDYLDELNVVGLAAAVDVEGETWTGTAGMHTSELELTPDLNFPIGSVSKTITAATILDMYEEGLLDLEDAIADYLPTYDNINPNITIRQLLKHTSGIYNYTNHPSFTDSLNADLTRIWTPQEMLDYFVSIPSFPPGASWSYSNTNYVLLGLIIESISGNTFHEEVKTRVLTPFGFEDIRLYPQEEIAGPYAHIWMDPTGTGIPPIDFYEAGGSLDALFSMAWAAGSYVATPATINQWTKALFGGQIVSTATLDEVQMSFPLGSGLGYVGYGLGTLELNTFCAEESAWGHGGDIVYSSQDYYFPEDDITVSVHCNDASVNSNNLIALVDELHCIISNFEVATNTTSLAPKDINIQTFPNPFIDQINIQYQLSQNSQVQINILNALGQSVAILVDEKQLAGAHTLTWEAADSGMYWVQVMVDGEVYLEQVVKM